MKDEIQERGEWLYAEFVKMADELDGPMADFFRESSEEIKSILDQRTALADSDDIEKFKKLEKTAWELHDKIVHLREQLDAMDKERN